MEENNKTAYQQGWDGHHNDLRNSNNPFERGTTDYIEWGRGWDAYDESCFDDDGDDDEPRTTGGYHDYSKTHGRSSYTPVFEDGEDEEFLDSDLDDDWLD